MRKPWLTYAVGPRSVAGKRFTRLLGTRAELLLPRKRRYQTAYVFESIFPAMCVAFWSLEHPLYALVLCNNRDEYLARPTAPAHWHAFGPIDVEDQEAGPVLSGRDLLAGGTWAGFNRSGKIALLTNITEPEAAYASSRGSLTRSFLLPTSPDETLAEEIARIRAENAGVAYAGFNLLLLNLRAGLGPDGNGGETAFDGAFLTNGGGGGEIAARMLTDAERRCGGMSNGDDGHGGADWPKVKHGRGALRDLLDAAPPDRASEPALIERLFGLLTWTSGAAPVARSDLRDTIQVEPISAQWTAGSQATASPRTYYGTRLSTVILVRRDGSALFIERDIWTLDAEGRPARADAAHDRVFRFQCDGQAAAEAS